MPQKIYLDTFVFMDLLSGDKATKEKALAYVADSRKTGAAVSAILFAELAYHIRRRKSREKAEEILFYIESLENLSIIPVTEEIAKHAGLLRARYKRLKIAKKFTYLDCVHIATAIHENCSKLVTGDKGFRDVKEIAVEIY